MPQLVKGGKYVFGWSLVNKGGRIAIPKEASNEYHFNPYDKVYIISGSRTSKGLAVTKRERIKNSVLMNSIKSMPELYNFKPLKNGFIKRNKKIYTWSIIDENGYFTLEPEILKEYYVNIGDKLLVGRGSGFALAFIKEGIIIKEALKHAELELFD